ncbi:hypothetical protein QQA05_04880 [Corynebacterium macclintockiae]|uniref:hypothetical protein n=1 Tax=Corynebacterium macclintockiae TaxID=2913501 RepID=UPI0025508EAF|nr:hypothetical protein [Corynebacterium macclintockiae]MDK8890735.1 hypothetical protein [Corynebacterium macclintockiae]
MNSSAHMNTEQHYPRPQGTGGPTGTPKPPKPPKVGRKDGLAPNLQNAPEDVRFGVWAWLAVSVLQLLASVVQFVSNLADPRNLTKSSQGMLDSQTGMFASVLADRDASQIATQVNVSSLIWGIVASVVCAFLALRAGRGGPYSRMFLNVASLFMILNAVLITFTSGPEFMPVGFVLLIGVLTILSGVGAALGMWFMARPENRDWLGVPSEKEMDKYSKELDEYRAEMRRQKEEAKQQKQQRNSKNNQNNNDHTWGGR